MGSGRWTRDSFVSYTRGAGRTVDSKGTVTGSYSNQEIFKSRCIHPLLNPYNVMRECCETEEHPNTIPVILALDVTGSMGQTAVEVANKLNEIMTKLYDEVEDVEFMIMGIGDLAYDKAPIQASQFESDIRIAEQLEKVYFEFGGGGNMYESYTAAWYFGSRHTKLDCWKRGRKGIIITMGDENINPYLPKDPLIKVTGDDLQADVETKVLYEEVSEKYDVYHINVDHRKVRGIFEEKSIRKSFNEYLEEGHYRNASVKDVSKEIVDIVVNEAKKRSKGNSTEPKGEGISW